jgi:hypothetical protein
MDNEIEKLLAMPIKQQKKKILEKDVEKLLVKRVRDLGGHAYKFRSPGRRSVPDRVVVLPGGYIYFVECKRPGGKLTDGQKREIERLKAWGQRVEVVYNYDDVNELMDYWKHKIINTELSIENEVTSLIRAHTPPNGMIDDFVITLITKKVREDLFVSVKKYGPEHWTEDQQRDFVNNIEISKKEIQHEARLIRRERKC